MARVIRADKTKLNGKKAHQAEVDKLPRRMNILSQEEEQQSSSPMIIVIVIMSAIICSLVITILYLMFRGG